MSTLFQPWRTRIPDEPYFIGHEGNVSGSTHSKSSSFGKTLASLTHSSDGFGAQMQSFICPLLRR